MTAMNKAVGIIPARWSSTRFPGKPLHPIAGKALLRRVWERCERAKNLDSVIIAPQLKAASAMSISSVAMITESRFFALSHRSHTRRKIALPAIGCNGFPGKRVELQRAGIMPTALFIAVILSEAKRSRRIPRLISGKAPGLEARPRGLRPLRCSLDFAGNDGGS